MPSVPLQWGRGEVNGSEMQTLDLRAPCTARQRNVGLTPGLPQTLCGPGRPGPSAPCFCFTPILSFFSVLSWEDRPRKKLQVIRVRGRAERMRRGFGTLTSLLLPIPPRVVPAHFLLTSDKAPIPRYLYYSFAWLCPL